MTTTNSASSNGNKLKTTIKNVIQADDRFSYVDNPIEREKFIRLNDLMLEYKRLEFGRYHSTSTLQAVYDFFGQHYFVDNTSWYPMVLTQLLKALARPEIGSLIKERTNYDSLLEIIDNLIDFCREMDNPIRNIDLRIYDIEHSPSEYTNDLDNLIEEYEERIKSSATGKIKIHY